MANEPILGSATICIVDQSGRPIRVAGVENGEAVSATTIRLLVELPDSALRDLGIVTVDGSVTTSPGLPNIYKQRLAYVTGTSNVEYHGYASPGAASSAASWAIAKMTYVSGDLTQIDWADGNTNFDNVWDDRTSLTYS